VSLPSPLFSPFLTLVSVEDWSPVFPSSPPSLPKHPRTIRFFDQRRRIFFILELWFFPLEAAQLPEMTPTAAKSAR